MALTVISLSLFGCAQNLWIKPNSTQAEFERDRYNCLQDSQQRVGSAQVNAYGGSAINTVTTNNMLYSGCMGAKGWSLQSKEVVQSQMLQNQSKESELKARWDSIKLTIDAMCSNPELKIYYEKTACNASDISFQHIAEESRITSEQKIVLVKQREQVAKIEKEQDVIQRERGANGQKMINVAQSYVRPENEKNNLDLYTGKITWGEYNKRRKEIAAEAMIRYRQ